MTELTYKISGVNHVLYGYLLGFRSVRADDDG